MTAKRAARIVFISLLVLAASIGILNCRNQNENQRFLTYTEDFFCQEVSGNTITLHYTLKDPLAYGIRDIPISLGSCTTDIPALCSSVENALALLHSFPRDRLSAQNQLTYDILEHFLSATVREAPYALYEEPFSPLTGTQAQLPVIFSEFQFYKEEDIQTYLALLKETPTYFQELLKFEEEKSKAGLFMASYSADDIIRECEAFVQLGEENYLYSSFEDRLHSVSFKGLSEADKSRYLLENASAIEQYVFPAYRELKEGLEVLRATGENNRGLCMLPNGQKYYQLLVLQQTGSGRSIPELKALTQEQIKEDLSVMQEVLQTIGPEDISSVSSDLFKTQGSSLPDADPARILSVLKNRLKGNFPAPPKVDTQIKYVQESMTDFLSPAFYIIPAIDNTTKNVIYINPGPEPDALTLFTTLAHEGYPGHLYQNVYYANQNPDPIRCLLDFGGYTEGWATYTEMLSYYFAPISKEQATLMQRNASVILGLYALADMGIHYDGWSLLDTVSFFRSYGITDANTIENIYDLIIADPANYLKYYIGYVEFLELKKEAVEKWGDEFSQKRFHKAVLEIGPAPFEILEKYIFLYKPDRIS